MPNKVALAAISSGARNGTDEIDGIGFGTFKQVDRSRRELAALARMRPDMVTRRRSFVSVCGPVEWSRLLCANDPTDDPDHHGKMRLPMTPTTPAFVVAIPARHGSTRLPGKALLPIAGIPMIVRVASCALEAGAREVVVATDDQRIAEALKETEARVVMTRIDHASGSDRLAECASICGWNDDQIVVNLQGDEPFAPTSGIRAVVNTLADSDGEMATLATPITDIAQVFDPACVKVVRDRRGRALYFSRAPLPWARDAFAADRNHLPSSVEFLRHIGIYAYRAGFLRRFAKMPRTPLEQFESLEQLRALEHGHAIAVGIAPEDFPPGIDTIEDLERAEHSLKSPQG